MENMRIRDPGWKNLDPQTDRKTGFFESIMEQEQVKKTRFFAVVYVGRPTRKVSVADPWNFGTDPDPWIHTSD